MGHPDYDEVSPPAAAEAPNGEYPKMLYHPDAPPRQSSDHNHTEYVSQIVHSEEDELALLKDGWLTSPPQPEAASPPQEPEAE